MLKKQVCHIVRKSPASQGVSVASQIFVSIVASLLSSSFALSADFLHSSPKINLVDKMIRLSHTTGAFQNRRDPFQPIKKRGSISSSPRKADPVLPAIDSIPVPTAPPWKLLGIIEGKFGRQAVIQLSPKKRVVVKAGSEVARSGWIVKTINPREILFEHSSSWPTKNGLSPFQIFVLSFSPHRTSF